MGLRVRDALKIGGLKGATILSGHGGLDNVIEHVDVIEMPNILDWLRKNTLMLTTFYAIKDDKEAQLNIVKEMATAGISALVIDPSMYIGELPKEIIGFANQVNLPIIQLPQEVGYIDVITPVIEAILREHNVYYLKTREINELFTDILLKKGGIQPIADALSGYTECSLVILDKSLKPLARANSAAGNDQGFPESIDPSNFANLLKTATTQENQLGIRVTDGSECGLKNAMTMFFPIRVDTEIYGYVMFWNVKRTFNETDLIAIEQASKVTAIEIIKQEAIRENQNRQRDVFFKSLLNGHFPSEEDVLDKAENMGISLHCIGSVIVVEICEPHDHLGSQEEILKSNIPTRAYQRLRAIDGFVTIEDGKKIVVVPRLDHYFHDFHEDATREVLVRIADSIKTKIEEYENTKVYLGIGRYYDKLTYLAKSYTEAQNALLIAKKLAPTHGTVLHFDQIGLYRLITKVEDKNELCNFYKEMLMPLVEYDEKNGTDLVGTLQEYFTCNENPSAAAKNLHVHLNTVKYRINRIKEILDIDDFTMENKTNLYVALKISPLLSKN